MSKTLQSIFNRFSIITLTLFIYAASQAQNLALPQMTLTSQEILTPTMTDYVEGTMVLTDTDGKVWDIPNVLLKTRGATAKQYEDKPSLNIKLKDTEGNELDTELLGLRKASTFILDAMAIDRIKMRNRVAFDIWNSFSRLPYETDFGSRNGTVGRFIEIFINGEYKGIYCLSDKINRKLLDLKKPEVEDDKVTIRGILYKNGTSDIEDQSTPGYFNDFLVFVPEWHDAWELHEPEDYASEEVWVPLADLYSTGADGKPNYENYNYICDHFWVENLADFALHTIALGIADNWGNKNRYFSIQNITKAGDKSRFVITPWDLDTSLGGEWDGSKYDGNLKEDWSVADSEKKIPMPLSICFAQPQFKKLMKERWLTGRIGAFSIDSVSARMNDFANMFIESGAWQRTLDAVNPHDLITKDLKSEIAAITAWYAVRFADMDDFLGVTEEDIKNAAGLGITEVDTNVENVIYNLQGIRMKNMSAPGFYIVNGKKILIK